MTKKSIQLMNNDKNIRTGTYVETYDKESVRGVYRVMSGANNRSAADKAREILKGVDKDSSDLETYILSRVGLRRA